MFSGLKTMFRCLIAAAVMSPLAARGDLVGHYQFEEGAGPSVLDTGTAPAANGTFLGGSNTAYVPGKVGASALDFMASATGRVNVGNPEKYQITGALTVSAWIHRDGTGRIVSKQGANGQRGWSLQIEGSASAGDLANQNNLVSGQPGNSITAFPANGAVFQISRNGSQVYGVGSQVSDGAIPSDRWVLLTGVYDPTGYGTATPTMYIYVDGVLNNSHVLPSSETIGGPLTSQFNSNRTVFIGGRPNGTGAGDTNINGDLPFDGRIDDVRIYNEALSPAAVAALVPEPGMTACGIVGLMGLFASRRRRS